MVREGDCRLVELYNTERSGDGFRVSSSAVWDLTTNHTHPAGWTSADAAGLPIFSGLLRYDEVAKAACTTSFASPFRRYAAPPPHPPAIESAGELKVRGSDFEVLASGPLTAC